MTTQTIAFLGGVVVLLLLLVAVRRRRAKAEATAPTRVGDVADIVVPAPAAITGPARLSAAEGMPPAAVGAPFVAPAPAPVDVPAAQAPPVAAEPLVVPQSWSSGEIVREPGWLMPGEVDNVWQADFAAAASAPVPEAAPVPVGAANGVGHVNGHGASAPDMGALIEGAIGGFDTAAGWGGAATVELDRPEPGDEPRIPQWDPVEGLPLDAAGGEPPADLSFPGWSEDGLVGWAEPAVEPDVEAWAAQAEAAAAEPAVPEAFVSEAIVPELVVAPEPVVRIPVVPETVGAAELAAWPVAEWAVEPAAEEPAEAHAEVAAEPLAEEPEAPAAPIVAWWDDEEEEEEVVAEAVPAAHPEAGTGRFALGGFALQPGHEAVAGVTFRGPLPTAPTAWAVAPAGEVAPGTLVLSVEGAVNTGPEGVAVLMDEGFAPSAEGFTVRAAARAAGPFAVSGTFRVR